MSHPAPKKCAICGQTAKIFVGFVADGKVTSLAWCEAHAAGEGLTDLHSYELAETGTTPAGRREESTLRCPACDCSQRDFERQGRLGCATCYTIFAGLLPPLLKRMHRDIEHRGKIPWRGADPTTVRHRLASLQAELRNAVRPEQFEGVAQTHDAIEAIKAKLQAVELSRPSETPTPNEQPLGQ